MKIKEQEIAVKLGGLYHGRICTAIYLDTIGVEISPKKILNRIHKYAVGKLVVLYGDVAVQPLHELAILIGDLIDLRYEVSVVLDEVQDLEGVSGLPSFLSVHVRSQLPKSSRVNELIWTVDEDNETFSNEINRMSLSNKPHIPVFVQPETRREIPMCLKILKDHPMWRLFTEDSIVLSLRTLS